MKKAVIKPKSIVNLSQLQEYDRFAFLTDKTKVWQVVGHVNVADYKGEQKKLTNCINDKVEKKRFASHRAVIYLRRNDPNAAKKRVNNLELIDY